MPSKISTLPLGVRRIVRAESTAKPRAMSRLPRRTRRSRGEGGQCQPDFQDEGAVRIRIGLLIPFSVLLIRMIVLLVRAVLAPRTSHFLHMGRRALEGEVQDRSLPVGSPG
jgi:hypothetical protein